MTASPPAPAALALSAEDLETVTYRLKFFEDDEFFPLPARTMRAILAALAAPAPAVVGEDTGSFAARAKDLLDRISNDRPEVEKIRLISAALIVAEARGAEINAAPRPSRDDGGEAVDERTAFERWAYRHAFHIQRLESGIYQYSRTEAAWTAWQAAKAVHQPTPAAEDGRVGELEAALAEADVLAKFAREAAGHLAVPYQTHRELLAAIDKYRVARAALAESAK